MQRIEDRLESLGRPPVVSFLAFVFLACAIGFAWRASALGDCGPALDARLLHGYTPDSVLAHLTCLGPDGRSLYAVTERTLDLVFPLVYVTLTAVLLVFTGPLGYLRRPWLVPMAGGALDVLENALLGHLASTYAAVAFPPASLVSLALALTRGKTLLLAASTMLAFLGWRRTRAHGWSVLGWLWLWMTSFAISALGAAGGALSLLALGVVVHWKWLYVGQYLFFLRYPLLVGVLFAFLPQLIRAEGSLLGNLLVLETPGGVLAVSFVATLVALTVMSLTRLVYLTAGHRMELPAVRLRTRDSWTSFWDRDDQSELKQALDPGGPEPSRETKQALYVDLNRKLLLHLCPWGVRLRAALFPLLSLPLLFGIKRVSPNVHPALLVAGWAIAVMLAFGLQTLERRVRVHMVHWWRGATEAETAGAASTRNRVRRLHRGVLSQLDRWFPGFGGKGHTPVVLIAMMGLLCYLGLSPLLGTDRSLEWALRLPPILYVFLITVVLTWVVSNVALLFDRARVPVVLLTVLALGTGFRLWGSDRYYTISANSTSLQGLPTPVEVVRARRPGTSGDFITVVAASGGGIKASIWTARVLQGLHDDVGGSITSSVVALSTNSGGSVGAMYYTDAFDSTGTNSRKLGAVVRAAGTSSLSSVVWGMAYPDLLRVMSAGTFPRGSFATRDRGWAMERRWESVRDSLLDPRSGAPPRRLGQWVRGVRAGWRPAHIFNSTVVETGAAMRIATVALSDADPEPRDQRGSETREFADLYPWADIDVTTAARLSATFPWISPMPRPRVDPSTTGSSVGPLGGLQGTQAEALDSVAFHLADGGYFDNFGVFSALDFLRRVTPDTLRTDGVRRVILVQIRSAPEVEGRPAKGGFLYSSVGPLIAQNAVRTSSQIGRNDEEISLLREAWAGRGVLVCPVVFELGVDGPVSWHLSSTERDALVDAWSGDLVERARALRDFLSAPPPSDGVWSCPEDLDN